MTYHISDVCRTFFLMAAGCPATVFRRAAHSAVFLLGAAVLFLAAPLPAAAQKGVHISYLADPGASFSIENAASQEKSGEYKGYVPSFMAFSRLPGNFNGAIWLRITLDTAFEKKKPSLTVNLGTDLPGLTRLFIPQGNGTFSVMESAPPNGVFTLPEDAPVPDILYARIDGRPGLWFRPHLEPAQDGSSIPPLHFILAGLFALSMLILLGQYIRKAEEWRVWAAVTAGSGVVAAVLPTIPSAGVAFTPLMAAGMVMPGLIMILFVHTTRHLFDSPRTMPGYDKILILLYLAGGGVALLPLVPGFLWVAPFLPLAYIALLPLLPLAMVALARSLRGCTLFLCACLLPVAGVAVSAWELGSPGVPWLTGNGGLWGLAFAVLLISFAAPDKTGTEAVAEEDVFDSLNRSHARELHTYPAVAESLFTPETFSPAGGLAGIPAEAAGPGTHEGFETDRGLPPETPPEGNFPPLSLFGESDGKQEPDSPAFSVPEQKHAPGEDNPESVVSEEVASPKNIHGDTLPIPDSALEKYPSAFPDEPEPPAPSAPETPSPAANDARAETPLPIGPLEVPVPVPDVPKAVRADIPALFTEETGYAGELSADTFPGDKDDDAPIPDMESRRILFNLPLLIKNAYDALTLLSENKNVGLTWFIAPQTGRLFEGEAELLESALRLLLRDMVESVGQGNVRLNVRRLPDSTEGHLVFSVAEWNAKQTSGKRKIAGLAEAWSLAEKTGGIFSVEHSPGSGTTVIFSAIFTAMDKTMGKAGPAEDEPPAPPVDERAGAAKNVPAATRQAPVQVFTDYPDTAMPEAAEDPSAARAAADPAGVCGDDLAGKQPYARDPLRIIVADIAASSRARTVSAFAKTPYSVLECVSLADALALYADLPAALVIMNADMPEVDIIEAIKDIQTDDDAHGRTRAHVVALVGYAEQAKRLMQAGCMRTVRKSTLESDLLGIVKELIPLTDTGNGAVTMPEAVAAGATVSGSSVPAAGGPVQTISQDAPEKTASDEAVPAIREPAPARRDTQPAETLPEEGVTPETLLDAALADIPSMDSETAASAPEAESGSTAYSPVEESGIFSSALPSFEPGDAPQPGKNTETPQGQPIKPVSSGLGLLEMIVTDDEPEETPSASTAAFAAPTAQSGPTVPKIPAATVSVSQTVKAAKDVRVVVRPGNTPKTGTAAQVRQVAAAVQPVPPAHSSIPLPGEDDSVFKDMVPLIPGLIVDLFDAMADAARGKEEKSPVQVQEAAGRVAGKAESFGLARLERMARCVERAAAADDIEPMECVLADLKAWVTRYIEALQQLHRTQQW